MKSPQSKWKFTTFLNLGLDSNLNALIIVLKISAAKDYSHPILVAQIYFVQVAGHFWNRHWTRSSGKCFTTLCLFAMCLSSNISIHLWMFTLELIYLVGFFVVDDNKQSARIPAHVRDNNQKQVKNGSKYGVRWNNKINILETDFSIFNCPPRNINHL